MFSYHALELKGFPCFLRISPSEGDSIGSDPPSERGSPEEGMRPAGLPTDPKQSRKVAVNGLNGKFVHILTLAVQSYIDVLQFFFSLKCNCDMTVY